MNVLLDVHAFLWWILADPQLSHQASAILSDNKNQLFMSTGSVWEIIIKTQIGKLPLPPDPIRFVREQLAVNAIHTLPISLEHVLQVYTLPLHHKDPFDRILVAQSQVEQMPILTADPLITAYGIPVIW